MKPALYKVLSVSSEQCVGCRVCELACSARHEQSFNPAKSRIHIVKWDGKGLDIPTVCQQCIKPPCVKACPVEAFYRDEKTGAVLINDDICIGCRLCIDKCPFGAIFIDPDKERMVKCDLCGGNPRCVKYCPTGALQYVGADRMVMVKKRKGAEKMANLLEPVIMGSG